LATHQLPAESRGGDGDAIANAWDDWLGGRIMPCPRCLTAKHNKTATMATSQGNWLEVPAILVAHFN